MNKVLEYRSLIFGFAALWIMVFHNLPVGSIIEEFHLDSFMRSMSLGYYGVDIFLFISGASLYCAFKKSPCIRTFYHRRVARILPAYLLTFVFAFIIIFLLQQKGNLLSHLKDLLFIDLLWHGKIGNLWFIKAILILYLLYPLLFFTQTSISTTKTFTISVLVATLLYAAARYNLGYDTFWMFLFCRIPVFCLGSLLMQRAFTGAGSFFYPKSIFSTLGVIVVFICAYPITKLLYHLWYVNHGLLLHYFLWSIPVTLSSIALIVKFAQFSKRYVIFRRILAPISALGTISLECYLIDQGYLRPLILSLMPSYAHPLIQGVCLIVTIIILAYILKLSTATLLSISTNRYHKIIRS